MYTSPSISRRRRSGGGLSLGQRIVLFGFIAIIILVVMGFITAFGIFAWYARDLPSPGKLSESTGFATIFYDREGKVLYETFKDKNRVPVTISEIPKNLALATVAVEDKNFYKHNGISETGIIRGFLSSVSGRGIQGGSTITQQLIKNVLLTSEQRLSRKIKEAILAIEVERRYTKDQILELYLNEAPYGGSLWGVGTAAKAYFGKDVKDLNLVECAILAGLPQSPSRYSPYIGKEGAWVGRTKDVLRRMREDKYITAEQLADSLQKLEGVTFTSGEKSAINAPHFVFYVRKLIEDQYGVGIVDKGIKVKTSLSLEVQTKTEEIVAKEMAKLKDINVGNGAVVVLDSQSGEILAMVGSKNYFGDSEPEGCTSGVSCIFDPNTNASVSLRQPGSTIKPIAYSLAFEKGYTPSSLLMDVKTVFPNQGEKDYEPVNYDGKFHGPVQLRFSLANSYNIPAVKLMAMIGIKDFLEKSYQMGISNFAPTKENVQRFGLSVALGGGESTLLEMTSAFSVFARAGLQKDVQSITEIKDASGKSIFKQVRTKEKRVLSPEVSFLVSHILSDNNARTEAFGPNSYLNVPGKTVAVKTGTTNDKRDNWAIGYTKSITVGVWVGNNDNSPMNPKIASGATGASPIWYTVMKELLKKYPDGIPDKPDNVEALSIDSFLGGLPKDGYPTRSEYFIKGTEPKEQSAFYKKVRISKNNGKIANDVESKLGQYDEKDYIGIVENDPVSTDGKNRWQEGIDVWAKEQSDNKYKLPTDKSDSSSDSLVVSIKSPSGQSTINSNSIELKARLYSGSPIKNVKIRINGTEFKNLDGDTKELNEVFNLSDGVYTLQIEARNDADKTGESTIKFGVNKPWDAPMPTTTPSPTP